MATEDAVRLTKRVVDGATRASADYTIWDRDVPGFGLCVRKSGRKVYLLKYRVGSGRGAAIKKPTIGTHGAMTVDQARTIARGWLAEARLGGDPGAARRAETASPLMRELFDRYLAEHAHVRKKPRSAEGDERLIALHLGPALGTKRVRDVARADVAALHSAMAGTPYAANRAIALLSKAFNLAELWGLRPDGSNPCRHVRKFNEEKRRRFLSEAEISALGAALDAAEAGEVVTYKGARISVFAATAIRLLLLTGARKSEILKLRWKEVDLEAGRLALSDSKTGAKFVYLPPAAAAVIRRLPRLADNPHVIVGGKPGASLVNLKDPWDAIRKAAGIEDVRLHDLRHSFASVAAAGGLSLPMIGALLGHREAATTARYAHLADDPIRTAAGAVGTRIAENLAGRR